jgi:hypothetical protein
MKGLNAWHMLDDEKIVSQFDRNFYGTINGKDVEKNIGLEYYNVIYKRKLCFVIFVNKIYIYTFTQDQCG